MEEIRSPGDVRNGGDMRDPGGMSAPGDVRTTVGGRAARADGIAHPPFVGAERDEAPQPLFGGASSDEPDPEPVLGREPEPGREAEPRRHREPQDPEPGTPQAEPVHPQELLEPETLPVQPVGGVVLGADAQAAPPRRRRRRWWQQPRAAGKARHAARKASGRAGRRARHAAAAPGTAEQAEHQHPEWHDSGARQTRWAALKDSAGGLMADFEPSEPDNPPEEG